MTTQDKFELPMQVKRVRRVVTGGTALISAGGSACFYYGAIPSDPNGLHWLAWALFSLLTTWIAFSFVVACVGFDVLQQRRDLPNECERTAGHDSVRCAVLVPIYNESPTDVFARVEAMVHELIEQDADGQFDFYVLSDSTDPAKWLEEEWVWAKLLERLGSHPRSVQPLCAERRTKRHIRTSVFYRHRAANEGRKAGNIADFCTYWANDHQFMIVLDADSLLSAETMIEMVRRMNADGQLGILQVPPKPIGRHSFFARLQQFAADVYSPVFVQGFDAWAGDEGNYWGHNAIIRIDAFRKHADLPVLPGVAPLGGAILSHDFVEAAMLVRRGWKVRLATDLGGSYEECPTTLVDYAIRDQRWCQGNLQHTRLLFSEGFRGATRVHFLGGLMSYLGSPLWILFLVLSFAAWTLQGPQSTSTLGFGPVMLFVGIMVMLLFPKFLALRDSWPKATESQSRGVLVFSAFLESMVGVLLAPIMAVLHTRFVLATLSGRNVAWTAQQRDESRVTLWDGVTQFGWYCFAGASLAFLAFSFIPAMLLWMSPLLAGLILSPLLAVVLGSRSCGRFLARRGVLLTAEERKPPRVHELFEAVAEGFRDRTASAPQSIIDHLLSDPEFFILHCRVLEASRAGVAVGTDERRRVLTAFRKTLATEALNDQDWRVILGDAVLLRELHLQRQQLALTA
ncbi:MAG: glucans biosynthesis glucosyltransferase MdoH [Planctomycetota bacterium]